MKNMDYQNIDNTGDIQSAAEKDSAATPNFLPYNTDMKPMRMPEYGRKIHELLEYAKLMEDREERTKCVTAIAEVMVRLFPGISGGRDDRKKVWDHINIMSDFSLDIDFPEGTITREELSPTPEALPYEKNPIKFRHYGRIIEEMIKKVVSLEEGEEKEQLILLIANQMKKQLLAHNKEVVSDRKVIRDLKEYSGGTIDLDPKEYVLHEYNELTPRTQGKKKKNK